jgi:hypothetical protein
MERLLVDEDREGCAVRGRITFEPSQLPGEMIERGSQVVNGVSEHEAESDRWLPQNLDPNDVLSALNVWFTPFGVPLTLEEPLSRQIESVEVLLRSVDLGPNAVKGGRHEALS